MYRIWPFVTDVLVRRKYEFSNAQTLRKTTRVSIDDNVLVQTDSAAERCCC